MVKQSEIDMDSPTERHTKKILVSLWSRSGLVGWRLVEARKVGRHYVVVEDAISWGVHRMVSPLDAYLKGDVTSPIALDNHVVIP